MSTASPTKAKTDIKVRTKHDWIRFDTVSPEQRHAAALADSEAQPIRPEDMREVVHALIIRKLLKLSQEEFAAQFHIPLGTLRDWEQRRKEPDAAARAYLKVIARAPEAVRAALKRPPYPKASRRPKAKAATE